MAKASVAKSAAKKSAAKKAAAPVDDSPVYVYVGSETGERDEAIKALAASMRKKCGSVEMKMFYASETTVGQALTEVQGVSLFDDAVCVVLRSAELIKKKDDVDMIVQYALTHSSGNSVLVLVSDENSIDARIDKAVSSQHKKIFYQMFDNRKVPYLVDFFRRSGYSISPDAASDILDMVENDTAILKAECARFFVLFPPGHQVTSEDVEAVLSHDREENAFTLFDAMTQGANPALERPLEILAKIRLSKENNSVMLVAGLASCFRRLAAWHKIGGGASEAALRQAGFASRRAREQYARAARVWTSGQCAAILAALCRTDLEIRSGGAGMEDTLLAALVYCIVVKKGASLASYE